MDSDTRNVSYNCSICSVARPVTCAMKSAEAPSSFISRALSSFSCRTPCCSPSSWPCCSPCCNPCCNPSPSFLHPFFHALIFAFVACIVNGVAEDGAVHEVAVIDDALVAAHAHEVLFLSCRLQASYISILGDVGGGKEIHPLLQRYVAPSVEVIHLQDDIVWIEVTDGIRLEFLPLEGRELQKIAFVRAPELYLALVGAVLSFRGES